MSEFALTKRGELFRLNSVNGAGLFDRSPFTRGKAARVTRSFTGRFFYSTICNEEVHTMTRIYRTIAVAVIGALVVLGCTKGYESQKTVDDLTIKLTVGSYPLVKGDNTLTVKVTDAAGKAVSDAKMDVRYYMPPMPGMAPMDFSGQAMLRGDAYAVSANIPMEGGWKVEVSVARPGRPASMATFNLDAR
jgi:hypothetical protein